MESAGVLDVLTKSLGSPNPHNVVKATVDGLTQLIKADRMASFRDRDQQPPPPAPVPATEESEK
jgi:small subunit ribosomal protein S5